MVQRKIATAFAILSKEKQIGNYTRYLPASIDWPRKYVSYKSYSSQIASTKSTSAIFRFPFSSWHL